MGPSIVGSKPNSSGARESEFNNPAKISVVLAAFRQPNVSPDRARDAHDGTPATKFCQSTSRRAALNSSAVDGDPDSKICSALV